MTFTTDTFARASFKKLQGLGHTGPVDPANESEASQITIGANEIFGQVLSTNPSQAITDGYAIFTTLTLTLDPASNGKAYTASIPTVSGSGLDGHINPRTGINYADADRVGFIIPSSFGSGYRPILKDGVTEIPPLDAADWFVDVRAGIVVSETNLALSSGTLECHIYVGEFVTDRFNNLTTDHGSLTNLTNADDHTQYVFGQGRLGGQTIIGGTGTTDDLILQTTNGVGATGADMHFLVGNNGGTEALTILNSGSVGIGTISPGATLDIDNNAIAEPIFIARDNGAPVFTIADGGASTFTQNLVVGGNLIIDGYTTTIDSEIVNISDNHLYLNNGYTAGLAQTGGIVVNINPDATATEVIVSGGFVAGVASTSNPTIEVVDTTGFTANDILQVSGSTSNDGLYEVLSLLTTPNRIELRGVGLITVLEDFTANQVSTEAGLGQVDKVKVSIIRSGADGTWETGLSDIVPITYSNLRSIAGNLVPDTTNTYTIGDVGLVWKDGYFGSGSIRSDSGNLISSVVDGGNPSWVFDDLGTDQTTQTMMEIRHGGIKRFEFNASSADSGTILLHGNSAALRMTLGGNGSDGVVTWNNVTPFKISANSAIDNALRIYSRTTGAGNHSVIVGNSLTNTDQFNFSVANDADGTPLHLFNVRGDGYTGLLTEAPDTLLHAMGGITAEQNIDGYLFHGVSGAETQFSVDSLTGGTFVQGQLKVGLDNPIITTKAYIKGTDSGTGESALAFIANTDTNFIGIDFIQSNNTVNFGSFKGNSQTGETRWFSSASYFPTIYSSNVERFRITSGGQVRLVNDGSAAAPTLTLGSSTDDDTGLWHPASDTLSITLGGVESVRFNSTNITTHSDLIPAVNDVYALGLNPSRWKDGYFGSGSIRSDSGSLISSIIDGGNYAWTFDDLGVDQLAQNFLELKHGGVSRLTIGDVHSSGSIISLRDASGNSNVTVGNIATGRFGLNVVGNQRMHLYNDAGGDLSVGVYSNATGVGNHAVVVGTSQTTTNQINFSVANNVDSTPTYVFGVRGDGYTGILTEDPDTLLHAMGGITAEQSIDGYLFHGVSNAETQFSIDSLTGNAYYRNGNFLSGAIAGSTAWTLDDTQSSGVANILSIRRDNVEVASFEDDGSLFINSSGRLKTALVDSVGSDLSLARAGITHLVLGSGGISQFAKRIELIETTSLSSGLYDGLHIRPTVSQSGTSGYRALQLQVTETSTGSGDGYLIHGEVGGITQFGVKSNGDTYSKGQLSIGESLPIVTTKAYIKGTDSGTGESALAFIANTDTNFIGIDFIQSNNTVNFGSFKGNSQTGETRWFSSASYFPTIYSSNVERFRITSGGQIRLVNDGSAAAPVLTFGATTDDDTGIFHPATDTLAIGLGGLENTRFAASGIIMSADLLPATNITHDLGTNAERWKDGYFGEIVRIGDANKDEGTISYNPITSGIEVNRDGYDIDFSIIGQHGLPAVLHVDAENHRVGVGTATPPELITINDSIEDIFTMSSNRAFFMKTSDQNSEAMIRSRSVHPDGRWSIDVGTLVSPIQAFGFSNGGFAIGSGETNVGGVAGLIGLPSNNLHAMIPRLRIAKSVTGPANVSSLVIDRSDVSEWNTAELYPSGSNFFEIRTELGGVEGQVHRAPLEIDGYSIKFKSGYLGSEIMRVDVDGYVGISGDLIVNRTVDINTATVTLNARNNGFLFTNEGATAEVNHLLPTAVAGLHYAFIVQDVDGIRVTAASGDTIRVAGSVSGAAGNITANTIGDSIKIVAANATEWITEYSIGTWTVSV